MKNLNVRWMFAAAALVVAAGSASAQTFTAEIPMAFHAGSKLMAAGTYQVTVATRGGTQIFLRSYNAHSAAVMLPGPLSDTPKNWSQDSNPRVAFACVDSKCTLRRLWTGSDSFVYNFIGPKAPTVEARRTEEVTLAMIRVR